MTWGPDQPLLADPERFPGLLPLRREARLLRLWRCPAFSPTTVWCLYRRPEGLVRRLLVDSGHTGEEEPWGADARLGPGELEAWRAELSALRLPLTWPEEGQGRDGQINGLELGDPMTGLRLQWWLEPPPGWEGLAAWHGRLLRRLDQLLPPHLPAEPRLPAP